MSKRRLKKKFKISLFLLITLIVVLIIGYLSIKILNNDKKEIVIPKTTTTKKEDINEATLTLVGDFLFEQPFYDSLNKGDNENLYFSKINKYFKNDDLSIGNMEVVIGNNNLSSSGTGYNFCAPESIGKLVSTLDLEVLATANNHSYDRGIEGINSTIDFFNNNSDIMTIGTFKEKEDRNKNKILNINNIKFGFLSYTLGTNIKIPESERFRVGLYRNPDTKEIDDKFKELITNEVNNLKKDTDIIIVMMHWGKEFTNTPNDEQKSMAKFLNSLGVDIIVGSHSHSIQPIEIIGNEKKTLVYYSLGNFVSADNDISRAGEIFDNAYQFGLLSQLKVIKNGNNIEFNNIITEPIINYYDSNMRNFLLIPYSEYTSNYETSHYRYNYNFNKNFIRNMYENVIDKNYR